MARDDGPNPARKPAAGATRLPRARHLAWSLGALAIAMLVVAGPTSVSHDRPAALALLSVYLVAVVSAFAGALARRRESFGWTMLAFAVASYATASYVYAVDPGIVARFPSAVDATIFVFYPLTLIALVALVVSRFPTLGPVRWLDTGISALALAALGAIVLRTTLPGHLDAVTIGQFAYAVGDLMIVGFLIATYVVGGRDSTPTFGAITLGSVLLALADADYVKDIGAGAMSPSTFTSVGWPAGALLLGLAATLPQRLAEPTTPRVGIESLPLLAAGVCLPIAMFATTERPFALTLAGLCLLTVIVRLQVSLRENRRLGRQVEAELAERAARFEHQRAILATAYDAFIGMDEDGNITGWNPSAERLLGWRADEVRGWALVDTIVPERYRDGHRAGFARYLESGEARILDRPLELEALRRDGGEVPVLLTITAIRQGDGGLAFAAFLKDLTERRRVERHGETRLAVAGVLADAESLPAAAPAILEALGSGLRFDYAELWFRAPGDGRLREVTHWQADALEAPALVERSRSLELRTGEGLPAGIWNAAEPVWLTDLALTQALPHSREVAAAGLRGGVVLVARVDREPVAVLTLLTREHRLTPEPGLLSTAAELRDQLATFIQRRRVEQQGREQAEDLMTVTGAVHELARATDAASARPAICQAALRISGGAIVLLHEPGPDGRSLVQTAAAGLPTPNVRLDLAAGSSGSVDAYLSGEPRFYADAATSPDLNQALVEATQARAAFFQPIISDGSPIAVLAVLWTRPLARMPGRLELVMNLLAAEVDAAIQRADLLARLESVARTDDLTGLLNRRAWNEELPREVARSRRDGLPLCVAVLDLDRFKAFNDGRGHQAGDRLLKEAAARWRGLLRATDVIARYGGEEFAIALPATDLTQAVSTLERLRLATPQEQTCSIGVAAWDGEESPDALTHRADVALYAAKESGRDRIVVAEPAPATDG